MSNDGTRLLFRKSDKVLLEFKTDEDEVIPTRGIRLDEGNIADFCYSNNSQFIYLMTDDGILHFRSKNLDKDYVIDRSMHFITLEGQYFCISVSLDDKYLACSSNFSDGTVTEHSLHVFELQGTKDPLFLHKITFITDYAHDWFKSLNFEISSKGDSVIAGCTATSAMMLTFALKDKHLEQFEKEFSLDENPDGSFILTQSSSAA
jgi:hypothetical protein